MADGSAEKPKDTETPPEKSPEEKEKDDAANDLLKEQDELDKADESGSGSEGKTDQGEGDTPDSDSETPDGDEDPDGSGSQPEVIPKGKRGFRKRQARLVKQREEAKKARDDLTVKLDASNEEKKLLQLKIEQLQGRQKPLTAPKPEDFDGGDLDPDFDKATQEYQEARLDRLIEEKVQKRSQDFGTQQTQQQKANALEKKQEKHWEEAEGLGVSDYDDKEGNLIGSIGAEMVSNIIDYFPGESAPLIYHLGTNDAEAERIGELLNDKSTLVQGVAQLGRILERIKVKGPKTSTIPDPDEDIQGSSPSPQESLQLRLEKLREDATKDGNKNGMKRILALKKSAKERGIALV